MVTRKQRRELLRAERRERLLLPLLVRRLTTGRPPRPRWLPDRLVAVVSSDLDTANGLGSLTAVWRPRSAAATTLEALVERSERRWEWTGGGGGGEGRLPGPRQAAGGPGQPGMIELLRSSGGMRSFGYIRGHPGLAHTAPWVGVTELRVAAEVDHLLVGERRVPVPDSGMTAVVWTSRATVAHGERPPIVAIGPDGAELSRLGPDDVIDSYTWKLLNSA